MPLLIRDPQSNKGDHGALGILGGSTGMVGAAFLSARSALFSGTGRTYIVRLSLDDGVVVDPLTPEIMIIDIQDCKDKPINTWVAGPGLGTSDSARQALSKCLNSDDPVVLDADALNLIAEDPALGRQCRRRHRPTVITPHPGEASRLLQQPVAQIQADRQTAAQTMAAAFHAVTVLKGHQTVITTPEGAPSINHSGNAALATAGTGDVLAGLIGSLIAQGVDPHQAALTAVHIHGSAAERLTLRLGGMIGVSASELIPEIRLLINAGQAPAGQG